jgi:hypothetical protein
MHDIRSTFRASMMIPALLALAACSGDRVGGFDWLNSSSTPAEPAPVSAPPVSVAGIWTLSSPGHSQCRVTFGSASPAATEGTIAPQGGCPGKFYMSRKWAFEGDSLVMRDHTGKPLGQLSSNGAGYEGKAVSGEPIVLMR